MGDDGAHGCCHAPLWYLPASKTRHRAFMPFSFCLDAHLPKDTSPSTRISNGSSGPARLDICNNTSGVVMRVPLDVTVRAQAGPSCPNRGTTGQSARTGARRLSPARQRAAVLLLPYFATLRAATSRRIV